MVNGIVLIIKLVSFQYFSRKKMICTKRKENLVIMHLGMYVVK